MTVAAIIVFLAFEKDSCGNKEASNGLGPNPKGENLLSKDRPLASTARSTFMSCGRKRKAIVFEDLCIEHL